MAGLQQPYGAPKCPAAKLRPGTIRPTLMLRVDNRWLPKECLHPIESIGHAKQFEYAQKD